MSARFKLIILDQITDSRVRYRVALWADVPAARQAFYASAGTVSAWTGALTADNTALANGSVAERVIEYSAEPGTTLAQVKSDLAAFQVAYQAEISAYNAWNRYGTTFDGATWVAAGAA